MRRSIGDVLRPSPIADALHASTIHLVNPLWDATGGADLRTVDLHRLLAGERPVRLWSQYRVDGAFRHLDVTALRPWHHPRGGTLVRVGVYFRNAGWIRRSHARRIVVIYDTDQPDRLQKTLARIGDQPLRIVYTSEALRETTRRALGGTPCGRRLITTGSCSRASSSRRPSTRSSSAGCGRTRRRSSAPSQSGACRATTRGNTIPAVCRSSRRWRVAGCGCGSWEARRCKGALRDEPNVELLAAGAVPSADFLSSLDAFYYRTHPDLLRGVRTRRARSDAVRPAGRGRGPRRLRALHLHGENGFLFDDPRDAMRQLAALRDGPALRQRVAAPRMPRPGTSSTTTCRTARGPRCSRSPT